MTTREGLSSTSGRASMRWTHRRVMTRVTVEVYDSPRSPSARRPRDAPIGARAAERDAMASRERASRRSVATIGLLLVVVVVYASSRASSPPRARRRAARRPRPRRARCAPSSSRAARRRPLPRAWALVSPSPLLTTRARPSCSGSTASGAAHLAIRTMPHPSIITPRAALTMRQPAATSTATGASTNSNSL